MQIKHLPENEYGIIMGLSSDDGVGIYTKNPEAIPWKRNGWNWGAQDTAFRFTPTLCPRTITDTIYVKGDVAVNVLGNDTTFCPGGNITIGTNYPGTNILWNTGETTPFISIEEAGTYTMQMHYGPGDCFLYDTIIVEANEADLFANVLGNDTTLCFGDTLDIAINYADTMYSFSWSTGDTSAIIKVNDAGNYAIEIEYVSGCSLFDTIAVNFEPPIIIESTSTPSPDGGPGGSILVTVSGGTPPYTYTWSDGLTGTEIDSLYPAIYMLTVTDALGCTAEIAVSVGVGSDVVNQFEKNIQVFPNPFTNQFIVISETPCTMFELYTLTGERLFLEITHLNNNYTIIETEEIAAGLYHLIIISADEMQYTLFLNKL